MSEFFAQNIIAIYFIYGLSFFSMGLAVLLEAGHNSESEFAQALKPLIWFGLVHGSHEWVEMFLLIQAQLTGGAPHALGVDYFRLFMLAASFFFLVAFGARLIAVKISVKSAIIAGLAVFAIWATGLAWILNSQPAGRLQIISADVYTRYALAIPGAALTMWGLLLQRQRFYVKGMHSFGNDVALAALAFGLYGGIGQLFTSASTIFPSQYLNASVFMGVFGFPIQVFRAAMACMASIFIIRSLRTFEVEDARRIANLRVAQQVERRRLEALRNELLHRTVKAQENERQRIARELHDETGQALTALGLGLRGLSEIVETKPRKASQQAKQLQELATQSLVELQRLVSGLHPPQLDDLGLLAALRWYAGETQARFGLPVEVFCDGNCKEIPLDTRVALFRIAQEAITNIVRHADASKAILRLAIYPEKYTLEVEDDGKGFDVEACMKKGPEDPCLGLMGMIERAAILGGVCQIHSHPGRGTQVQVEVPAAKKNDGTDTHPAG